MFTTATAMPRKPSKRNDLPVKIDAEVVRMARIIAAFRDTTLAEVMSETLRPLLEKQLAQLTADQIKKQKPRD